MSGPSKAIRMEQMRSLITAFPKQMSEAWSIANGTPFEWANWSPKNVLILGMGGSGISGVIASKMLSSSATVPIMANSDYVVPAWVDAETLIVACSYSGNTEETLAALKSAAGRGATVAAVTSGGTLGALCDEKDWPSIRIPGGEPPRSQFGLAFTSVMRILRSVNLVPDQLYESLGNVSATLTENQSLCIERANAIADLVEGKSILLYADASQEGLLARWRQQLNENSKLLCSHHVFPEMNHNELVGWESGSEDDVVIMIQTPEDHPRTRIRMEICADIFQNQGADVLVVEGDGDDEMTRFFDLIHVGDWLSLILAERSGVDPVDIRNIDHLKNSLAKID